ncbi:hypothetical protein [Streptomyces sp. TLI_146]|uniref:hypothetical protein n=1 Tax=Streptomyces sp. TLI_146 TaxID=1938858 RepID=UPI000CB5754A|nr:hypothetical protein [Streptomyces sp. TLI_146]PKV89800.1 hypothetical protein BX283_7444 [Streptomyces sp. TLI_146]
MSEPTSRPGPVRIRARIRMVGGLLACSMFLLGGCTTSDAHSDKSAQTPPSSSSTAAAPAPSPAKTWSSPAFPGPKAEVAMGRIATRWGMEVHRLGRYGDGPMEAKRILPEGFTLWVRMSSDDDGRVRRVECMALNSMSQKVAATLAECADIAVNGKATAHQKEWISAQLAVADKPDGPGESTDTLTESGFIMRLAARDTGTILTITRAA